MLGRRREGTLAEHPIVAIHVHKEKTQHTTFIGGKNAKPKVYCNPQIF